MSSSSSSTQAAVAADVARAEQLVDGATAAHLSGPEWQINMAVCDLANANHTVGEAVVRALQSKLQSESPRTVLQALVLVEAVVKNGPPTIHSLIGTRSFLNAVAALTDGSLGCDVQSHALALIKQWASAFAGSTLAAFEDVYRQLKLQGVDFPELAHDAPVFTPPRSTVAGPSATTHSSTITTNSVASTAKRSREQQLAKLHADLQVVLDRIAELRSLWTTSGGLRSDALDDALDFLRQCQPRMNTLIEGGIVGTIDEQTLERCLTVNDHLIRALDETRGSATAPGPAATPDLMAFDSPPKQAGRKSDDSATAAAGIGNMRLQSDAPMRASAQFAAAADDDDFDAFLSSRAKQ